MSIGNAGEALPSEALERVWESFYRADSSRTVPGTGLGLPLVKSIIDLHQGNCYARNTVFQSGDAAESGVAFGFTIRMS